MMIHSVIASHAVLFSEDGIKITKDARSSLYREGDLMQCVPQWLSLFLMIVAVDIRDVEVLFCGMLCSSTMNKLIRHPYGYNYE